MSLTIRRVVTGHDEKGRAVVLVDEACKNVVSKRERHQSCVVWSTGAFPAYNSGEEDGGARNIASSDPNGSVFRIVRFEPGVAPRTHRTESIDYAVVISGAIDMELDDGCRVHLAAGDALVQRGTMHNWINRGGEPCVIAFVLIAARPVEREGRTLRATG